MCESQTAKLSQQVVLLDVSQSVFNYVMGNQTVYYNIAITVEISNASIILAMICGCVYQTYK
jgi:hypothetical protein